MIIEVKIEINKTPKTTPSEKWTGISKRVGGEFWRLACLTILIVTPFSVQVMFEGLNSIPKSAQSSHQRRACCSHMVALSLDYELLTHIHNTATEMLGLQIVLHSHRTDAVIRRAELNLVALFILLLADWVNPISG